MGSFLGTARDGPPTQNAQPNRWSLTTSPGNKPGVTLSASPRACPSPTTSPGNKPKATHSKISQGPRPSPHDVPGQWARGSSPNFTPAAILAFRSGQFWHLEVPQGSCSGHIAQPTCASSVGQSWQCLGNRALGQTPQINRFSRINGGHTRGTTSVHSELGLEPAIARHLASGTSHGQPAPHLKRVIQFTQPAQA